MLFPSCGRRRELLIVNSKLKLMRKFSSIMVSSRYAAPVAPDPSYTQPQLNVAGTPFNSSSAGVAGIEWKSSSSACFVSSSGAFE
jgi:hypothetical protein